MAQIGIHELVGQVPTIECVTDVKDVAEVLGKVTSTLSTTKDVVNNHCDVLLKMCNSINMQRGMTIVALVAVGLALGRTIELGTRVENLEALNKGNDENDEPELVKETENK